MTGNANEQQDLVFVNEALFFCLLFRYSPNSAGYAG